MAKLVDIQLPSPPMEELTGEFIDVCIHEDERVFASGASANNHVDGGYDEVPAPTSTKVITELARFSAPMFQNAAFLAPVPNGANGWADALKTERRDSGLIVVKSAKTDRREFVETDETKRTIEELLERFDQPSGVVIDDVTMDGGTGEAMADFYSERGLTIDVVISLLYRGKIDQMRSKYRRAALMRQSIPFMLDWSEYRTTGQVKEIAA